MAYWQDTPGHAWLYLSPDELARLPEIARRPSYEEDVEWAIAVLALPELAENKKLFGGGKEATLKLARELLPRLLPGHLRAVDRRKGNSREFLHARRSQVPSRPRQRLGRHRCVWGLERRRAQRLCPGRGYSRWKKKECRSPLVPDPEETI